jgi:hypothetical protein
LFAVAAHIAGKAALKRVSAENLDMTISIEQS